MPRPRDQKPPYRTRSHRTRRHRTRRDRTRRLVRCVLAIGVLFVLAATETARAQGMELRLLGGRALEEYETGAGGAVGVNLPTGVKPVFVGARGVYYLPVEKSGGEVSMLLYGIDVGVTLVSSPLIIRAAAGVGQARVSEESTSEQGDVRTDITRTTNTYYVEPAILIGASLGPIMVGVEGRYIRVDKGPDTPAVYAMVGFRLGR